MAYMDEISYEEKTPKSNLVKAKENKRKQQIPHTWASSNQDGFKFMSVQSQNCLAILS